MSSADPTTNDVERAVSLSAALTEGELELLRSLLARWRATRKSARETRWDFNLVEGELAESELAAILKSLEVKRDFRFRETGNVFVETGARSRSSGVVRAGVAASRSSHVAFVLGGGLILIVQRERLLDVARRRGRRVSGPERSVGYVVSVKVLVDELRALENNA